MRFKGKVVAVTGAARGIGRNIATAFGRQGATVVICDVDAEKGNATASELGRDGITATYLHADLAQRGAPQAAVRRVAEQSGRLDIWVNNARSGARSLAEETEESWDLAMGVTLRAAFFATQEAVRVMKQFGGGSIVNVSSTTAQLAAYNLPATYQICKAGMIQMTRYFATHAGPDNVRVNAVLPGFIVQDEHRSRFEQTDNRHYRDLADSCHPLRRTGSSDDVANACVFLSSPEAGFITGESLVIDGAMGIQEHFSLMFDLDRKGLSSNAR